MGGQAVASLARSDSPVEEGSDLTNSAPCQAASSLTSIGRSDRRGSESRPRSRQRSSPQESARPDQRKSVSHPHRSPEKPANPTDWLSTNAELKGTTITLHVEGCPILRRSRRRALRVLTGPLTWPQIAVLPDHGYQACGLRSRGSGMSFGRTRCRDFPAQRCKILWVMPINSTPQPTRAAPAPPG